MVRSTFSNLGSAISIFVEVLGPKCFSSWSSYFRDFSVGSSLLFTMAQQRFCSCSVVLSFPHRSRLRIWIVALHSHSALETALLVVGRVVGDVDRREVVQVPAVGFCAPDRQLRSSVLLVILPLAQDRGMVVVFLCSFLGVFCFPMVFWL